MAKQKLHKILAAHILRSIKWFDMQSDINLSLNMHFDQMLHLNCPRLGHIYFKPIAYSLLLCSEVHTTYIMESIGPIAYLLKELTVLSEAWTHEPLLPPVIVQL